MIRFRIAVLFSVLTGLSLVLFMSLIYFYTRIDKEDEFYQELMVRAGIVGQYRLEKDEVAAEIYSEIIETHLVKLPEEREYVIPLGHARYALDSGLLSPEILSETVLEGNLTYRDGPEQWASLLYEDNQGDFIILISAIDKESIGELAALKRNMGLGLAFTLLVQFAVGWAFAKSITYPLTKMSGQLKSITATDLSHRVKVQNTQDELGHLADTLNSMLGRLEKGFEVQRKFIASASHELRTPLTVIMGESEIVLRQERDKKKYIQVITKIQKEGENLSSILHDLMQLTAVSSGLLQFHKERINLADVILDVQSQMFHFAGRKDLIIINYDQGAEIPWITGQQRWIALALSNVLRNAMKYSGFKETVLLNVKLAQGNELLLEIIDRGIGIPADEISAIPAPFYRARNAGTLGGRGIGLSIVDEIVKLHGGSMYIRSELNKGTTVYISLPLAP